MQGCKDARSDDALLGLEYSANCVCAVGFHDRCTVCNRVSATITWTGSQWTRCGLVAPCSEIAQIVAHVGWPQRDIEAPGYVLLRTVWTAFVAEIGATTTSSHSSQGLFEHRP